MRKLSFLLFVSAFALSLSVASFALPEKASQSSVSMQAPDVKKTKAKLKYNVGLGGATNSVYRGAMLSQGGSFMPKVSLQYGSLIVAGAAYIYTIKVKNLGFSLGANYFNDNGFNKRKGDFRQQRLETVDSWLKMNLPLWQLGQLKLGISQDIRAHWGQYFTLGLEQKFLKYFSGGVTAGGGTLATNKYIYGQGAVAGVGHTDLGLSYSQAVLPWKGRLSLSLSRSFVVQDKNRQASFVRKDDVPLTASTAGNWSF